MQFLCNIGVLTSVRNVTVETMIIYLRNKTHSIIVITILVQDVGVTKCRTNYRYYHRHIAYEHSPSLKRLELVVVVVFFCFVFLGNLIVVQTAAHLVKARPCISPGVPYVDRIS